MGEVMTSSGHRYSNKTTKVPHAALLRLSLGWGVRCRRPLPLTRVFQSRSNAPFSYPFGGWRSDPRSSAQTSPEKTPGPPGPSPASRSGPARRERVGRGPGGPGIQAAAPRRASRFVASCCPLVSADPTGLRGAAQGHVGGSARAGRGGRRLPRPLAPGPGARPASAAVLGAAARRARAAGRASRCCPGPSPAPGPGSAGPRERKARAGGQTRVRPCGALPAGSRRPRGAGSRASPGGARRRLADQGRRRRAGPGAPGSRPGSGPLQRAAGQTAPGVVRPESPTRARRRDGDGRRRVRSPAGAPGRLRRAGSPWRSRRVLPPPARASRGRAGQGGRRGCCRFVSVDADRRESRHLRTEVDADAAHSERT